MGITQQKRRRQRTKHRQFRIAQGQIDGASGICPVRGHSNVQGDRTVGIWEK